MSAPRRLTWVSLADQRNGREQYWLSRMPDTDTTVLAAAAPLPVPGATVWWERVTYRRPVRRFVEAGAVAWVRDLDAHVPADAGWVASLECCSLVTGQVARLARGRPVRQAVVLWENDPRQPLYSLPPFRQALRDTLATADLFACMIDGAADHLRVLGVPSRLIEVVHPGVDLDVFHPAARPVTEPVIAFVSPLIPTKGVDRLLAALPLVRAQVPGARVRIMGEGPLAGEVRRAAATPGSGVEYVEPGDAHAVADTLRSAAVFSTAPRANVKWAEQFGLAYLEAMATGLPVVTTATGTNVEAVADGNERTVDTPQALAAGLVRMLRDPALRADVGRANRARVEAHHDLRRQTVLLGEVFSAAEARAPRDRPRGAAPLPGRGPSRPR